MRGQAPTARLLKAAAGPRRSVATTAPAAPPAAPSAAAGGRVAFVGAPFSLGQRLAGVDLGPRALRELADLPRSAAALGWRWHDSGDVPVAALAPAAGDDAAAEPGVHFARNSAAVGATCAAVHAACAAAARAGDFVLLAGGDHSVAAGSVSAALAVRPGLGVIWVDAHADINTPRTSPSGNLHGMPVALLLGAKGAEAGDAASAAHTGLGREWEFLKTLPPLDPDALVYIGLRDLDPEEGALVRTLNIKAFSMQDIDQRGIARVMTAALRHLKGRPLHLSFDVDACDPGVILATGTAVPGGLSYREAHFICEAVAETKRLCSMDVVEVNPTIGSGAADSPFSQAGVSSTAATASFILSALGKVTLPKPAKVPRPRTKAAASR